MFSKMTRVRVCVLGFQSVSKQGWPTTAMMCIALCVHRWMHAYFECHIYVFLVYMCIRSGKGVGCKRVRRR